MSEVQESEDLHSMMRFTHLRNALSVSIVAAFVLLHSTMHNAGRAACTYIAKDFQMQTSGYLHLAENQWCEVNHLLYHDRTHGQPTES